MMIQCYANDALALVNVSNDSGNNGNEATLVKLANLAALITSFNTLADAPYHTGITCSTRVHEYQV
jgi:hypothetical protein